MEARRNQRFDAIFKVTYDSFSNFYKDYTINISKGGTFIITEQDFNIGDKIKINLSFPKLLETLPMEAEVMWTFEDISDNFVKKGIGVKFIFKSDYHKRKFEKLIDFISRHFKENTIKVFKIFFYHPNQFIRNIFADILLQLNTEEKYKDMNLVIRYVTEEVKIIPTFLNEKFDLILLGSNDDIDISYYLGEFKKHDDLIPYIGIDTDKSLFEKFDFVLDKPYTLSKIKLLLDTFINVKGFKE